MPKSFEGRLFLWQQAWWLTGHTTGYYQETGRAGRDGHVRRTLWTSLPNSDFFNSHQSAFYTTVSQSAFSRRSYEHATIVIAREDVLEVKRFVRTSDPSRNRDDDDEPTPTQRASGSLDSVSLIFQNSNRHETNLFPSSSLNLLRPLPSVGMWWDAFRSFSMDLLTSFLTVNLPLFRWAHRR